VSAVEAKTRKDVPKVADAADCGLVGQNNKPVSVEKGAMMESYVRVAGCALGSEQQHE